MSNLKRTVENGRKFDAATRRVARNNLMKTCAYGCGEKATLYDHVNPLENNGNSDHTNCAYICTKCHSIKSKKERIISELGNPDARKASMLLHIARYQARVFNKDGTRKEGTRKETIAKKQKIIQKIHYYGRLADRSQNAEMEHHYRQKRAEWRRKLAGKKEW